jgi:hypothetical protein
MLLAGAFGEIDRLPDQHVFRRGIEDRTSKMIRR